MRRRAAGVSARPRPACCPSLRARRDLAPRRHAERDAGPSARLRSSTSADSSPMRATSCERRSRFCGPSSSSRSAVRGRPRSWKGAPLGARRDRAPVAACRRSAAPRSRRGRSLRLRAERTDVPSCSSTVTRRFAARAREVRHGAFARADVGRAATPIPTASNRRSTTSSRTPSPTARETSCSSRRATDGAVELHVADRGRASTRRSCAGVRPVQPGRRRARQGRRRARPVDRRS